MSYRIHRCIFNFTHVWSRKMIIWKDQNKICYISHPSSGLKLCCFVNPWYTLLITMSLFRQKGISCRVLLCRSHAQSISNALLFRGVIMPYQCCSRLIQRSLTGIQMTRKWYNILLWHQILQLIFLWSALPFMVHVIQWEGAQHVGFKAVPGRRLAADMPFISLRPIDAYMRR